MRRISRKEFSKWGARRESSEERMVLYIPFTFRAKYSSASTPVYRFGDPMAVGQPFFGFKVLVARVAFSGTFRLQHFSGPVHFSVKRIFGLTSFRGFRGSRYLY